MSSNNTSLTTTLARLMLALAGAVVILVITAGPAEAQATPAPGHEMQFLVSSGTIVPTGALRDDLKRGNVSVAQFMYVVRPEVAITASLGWGRTRDIATRDNPKVNVFTSDLGAEFRVPRWITSHGITFSPFSGVGAGARSYDYRAVTGDATHNISGYLSGGGGQSAALRNDVIVMAGLRIGRR